MYAKSQLRNTLRRARRMVPELTQKQNAEQLAKHLLNYPAIIKANNIALYLAQDGEINLTPTLAELWKAGKNCYLPVITPDSKVLKFARYAQDSTLTPNQFAILEPANTPHYQLNELDIVLVPLVAYDNRGHRLGRGGGYYDFTFAANKGQHKPLAIGCAYAFQQQPPLPADSWDIALDAIATEQGITSFVNP